MAAVIQELKYLITGDSSSMEQAMQRSSNAADMAAQRSSIAAGIAAKKAQELKSATPMDADDAAFKRFIEERNAAQTKQNITGFGWLHDANKKKWIAEHEKNIAEVKARMLKDDADFKRFIDERNAAQTKKDIADFAATIKAQGGPSTGIREKINGMGVSGVDQVARQIQQVTSAVEQYATGVQTGETYWEATKHILDQIPIVGPMARMGESEERAARAAITQAETLNALYTQRGDILRNNANIRGGLDLRGENKVLYDIDKQYDEKVRNRAEEKSKLEKEIRDMEIRTGNAQMPQAMADIYNAKKKILSTFGDTEKTDKAEYEANKARAKEEMNQRIKDQERSNKIMAEELGDSMTRKMLVAKYGKGSREVLSYDIKDARDDAIRDLQPQVSEYALARLTAENAAAQKKSVADKTATIEKEAAEKLAQLDELDAARKFERDKQTYGTLSKIRLDAHVADLEFQGKHLEAVKARNEAAANDEIEASRKKWRELHDTKDIPLLANLLDPDLLNTRMAAYAKMKSENALAERRDAKEQEQSQFDLNQKLSRLKIDALRGQADLNPSKSFEIERLEILEKSERKLREIHQLAKDDRTPFFDKINLFAIAQMEKHNAAYEIENKRKLSKLSSGQEYSPYAASDNPGLLTNFANGKLDAPSQGDPAKDALAEMRTMPQKIAQAIFDMLGSTASPSPAREPRPGYDY